MIRYSSQRTWKAASAALFALVASAALAASPELEKTITADKASTKALNVVDAKSQAKDAEKVVVQGKVKDFVNGQAVFTLIDNSMKSCKDNGENCPTPWDYCCNAPATIAKNTATVKIVDPSTKKALKENVQGVNGIDHLVAVTVEGTAQKDKAGNLVVLADKIYTK